MRIGKDGALFVEQLEDSVDGLETVPEREDLAGEGGRGGRT